MMQERARGSFDADLVADSRDVEPIERLDGRARLTTGRAERREVVATEKRRRGRRHRGRIEWARHPPHAIPIEGRRRATGENAIEVMPRNGAETRVEAIADDHAVEDRDGRRFQVEVHRVAHRVRRPLLDEIEMRDLAERVHARVRAAGAAHLDGLAAELVDGFREAALDGLPVRLDLPADERRAVVFDRDAVAGHSSSAVRSER